MIKKVLLVVLLLMGLLAVAVIVLHRPPPQTFSMANGTVVTFCGVTYGASNRFVWGTPIQKLLYKVLPAKYKSKSGCLIQTAHPIDTNNPIFWVCIREVTNGMGVRRGQIMGSTVASFSGLRSVAPGFTGIWLLDEYGCEYEPQVFSMNQPAGGRLKLCHYQMGANPPHGRVAGICFYDDFDRAHKAGQFIIPGMALTPVADFATALSPSTAADEPVVRLTGLTTGLTSVPLTYPPFTNSLPFTQARFRITEDGKPSRWWRLTGLAVTKPGGQAIRPQLIQRGWRNDEFVLNFEGVLNADLGSYRLEVEALRLAPGVPINPENYRSISPYQILTFKATPVLFSTNAASGHR